MFLILYNIERKYLKNLLAYIKNLCYPYKAVTLIAVKREVATYI